MKSTIKTTVGMPIATPQKIQLVGFGYGSISAAYSCLVITATVPS